MECMSLEQMYSVYIDIGPLDYNELFICLVFSTIAPCSERYAMHVSADMTACPWKLNHGDHHFSCFYHCHTHTRFPRRRSNPRHDVPRHAPHPSRPHRFFAFVCMTCGPAELRRPSTFYRSHTRLDAVCLLRSWLRFVLPHH